MRFACLLLLLSSHAAAEPVSSDFRFTAGALHAADDVKGNDLLLPGSRIRIVRAILGLETFTDDKIQTRIAFDAASQSRRTDCESNPEIVKYVRKLKRCGGEALREAYMTANLSRELTVRIGRDRINQGGFAGVHQRAEDFFPSPYIAWHQPFEEIQSTIGMSWKGMSLQLTDDVTTAAGSTGTFTRRHFQPAAVIQYSSRGETVTPLLQAALYDLNRSYFVSAGIEISISKLRLTLDTTEDHRQQKFILADGGPAPGQIFRNHTATGEMPLSSDFSPFFRIKRMDVTQPALPAAGLTDVSHNSSGFDDNYLGLGAGFKISGIIPGNHISMGWQRESGRFLRFADSSAKETRRWDTWYLAITGLDSI